MMISTEQQLEDRLSEPSTSDARAMAALEGDILIHGVAGKMGPSLARRARRACELAGVKKRIKVALHCCQSVVAASASGVGTASERLRSNTCPAPSNSTSMVSPGGVR